MKWFHAWPSPNDLSKAWVVNSESNPKRGRALEPGSCSSEVPAEPSGGAPVRRAELEGRRILIFDNAASQRGALLELAQTMGLEAAASSSGDDAVQQLRAAVASSVPFDFVLIDYELPGTRGPGLVAARISAEPALAQSSVFLMVPYSLRVLSQEPSPPGLRGIVSKPVRMTTLGDVLTGQRPVLPLTSAPVRTERRAPSAAGSPRSYRRRQSGQSAGGSSAFGKDGPAGPDGE